MSQCCQADGTRLSTEDILLNQQRASRLALQGQIERAHREWADLRMWKERAESDISALVDEKKYVRLACVFVCQSVVRLVDCVFSFPCSQCLRLVSTHMRAFDAHQVVRFALF